MSEDKDFILQDVEFQVSPEALVAADKARKELRSRSFSGRNPQLGKMMNCSVCELRHRVTPNAEGKFVTSCVQKFKLLHYEQEFNDETNEWGPEQKILAQAAQNTKRGILGAAQFKGKRIKVHPSKIKLLLVERTREVFADRGFSLDGDPETVNSNLKKARAIAARYIRRDRKRAKQPIKHIQQHSRRINRGLATPGSR